MRARLPQSGYGERGSGMAQRGGLLLPGEPRPRRPGRRRISAGTLPRQSRRARRDAPALRGRAAEGGGGPGGVRPAGCEERQGRGLSGNRHGVPRDGAHRARRVAAPLRDRAGRRRGDRKSTRLKLQSPCNLVCRLLLEKKKKKMQRRQKPSSARTTPTDPATRSPASALHLPSTHSLRWTPTEFAMSLWTDACAAYGVELLRSPRSASAQSSLAILSSSAQHVSTTCELSCIACFLRSSSFHFLFMNRSPPP